MSTMTRICPGGRGETLTSRPKSGRARAAMRNAKAARAHTSITRLENGPSDRSGSCADLLTNARKMCPIIHAVKAEVWAWVGDYQLSCGFQASITG